MHPLTEDENSEAAELGRQQPLGYFEMELPELPLTRLRDRTFELLAWSITQAQIDKGESAFDKATLLNRGADKGRDVLLLKDGRVIGIIQCKRYEKAIDLPSVLRELMRFALLAVRQPNLVPKQEGFGYQLWTATEISGPALAFFDAPRAYIEGNKLSLLEAARKARLNVVALTAPNEAVAEAENRKAAKLISGFSFKTIGPNAIKSALADDESLRRRFFRGPKDGLQRARADQIEQLLRATGLTGVRRSPYRVPYVARKVLADGFEQFLKSPAQAFFIVGTSGQGKSCWTDWVCDNPPPSLRPERLRGEDISSGDRHIIDTLARLLASRPLGDLSEVDLRQALFDWFDNASRLFLIDGLDRSTSRTLHDWLSESLALLAQGSSRLIATSRQAAWGLIEADLRYESDAFIISEDAAKRRVPILDLGPLEGAEIAQFYHAYGLPQPSPTSRPFRTPGLIALEARARAADRPDLGIRLAVLESHLDDVQRQLHRQASVGAQQFAQFTETLGNLLVDGGEGVIDAALFRKAAPRLLSLLDAAIEADLAHTDGISLRVEPDDLVEMLMARQLDPKAARHLVDRNDRDLAIGAAALAIARLEPMGKSEVKAGMSRLVENTSFGDAALVAAARAITELKDRSLIRELVADRLKAWNLPNMVLPLSPWVRLLDEVDLPPIERLNLAMLLADGEDSWDWRGKYFSGGESASRTVTGFGAAAARSVAADPDAALHYLLGLFDRAKADGQPLDEYESVESGLLYLAIDGAPELAADLGWARRSEDLLLLKRVRRHVPDAMARLLRRRVSHIPERMEIANEIWSLLADPPMEMADMASHRALLAQCAQLILPDVTDDGLVTRMLIAIELASPSEATALRLAYMWSLIDDEAFWLGIEARPEERFELISARIQETADAQSLIRLMSLMPVHLFPPASWPQLVDVLEQMVPGVYAAGASLVIELLLYSASVEGNLASVMPLARCLAGHPSAEVRLPIIYFTTGGNPTALPEAMRSREELLGILTEHEDGGSLDQLVWKLMHTAYDFPSALPRLARLGERLGNEAVDTVVGRWKLLEADGFRLLQALWLELPDSTRPDLPTFSVVV